MDAALRAGIAIYDEGFYHAAHDAWEVEWLGLANGSDDERFLHGLIQFTAAVHHGRNENWPGVRGLAESATGYLRGLPADYRGVNLDAVREFLASAKDDPEGIDWAAPPVLTYRGEPLALSSLDEDAALAAAPALAEEFGYDEDVAAEAVDVARRGDDRLRERLLVFVREPDRREEAALALRNRDW